MISMKEKNPLCLAQYEHMGDYRQTRNSEQAVQVIIVEAHMLIRMALQRVIGSFPLIQVSACLSKVQDVLALFQKGGGDVLLLGSSLTASDCLECVKMIQQARVSLSIVVIQQQLFAETLFPLLKSGVQGLLSEDASEKDLARAIEAAATGSTFIDQRAREILDASFSHIPLHFTEREMQVLPLLRLGVSNFCIAQQLSLKEKTVEKHLTHIYEKLHIRSRTEAVLRLQSMHI
jgi:DNA-binding NarL/FixJ family response regulator